MAGGVGAFAGDGVGKWAAVAVARSYAGDVCRVFVFSDATDWRRTQKRSVSGLQRQDETTSTVARAVERGELSIGIR